MNPLLTKEDWQMGGQTLAILEKSKHIPLFWLSALRFP
jgi:hypothetical protein